MLWHATRRHGARLLAALAMVPAAAARRRHVPPLRPPPLVALAQPRAFPYPDTVSYIVGVTLLFIVSVMLLGAACVLRRKDRRYRAAVEAERQAQLQRRAEAQAEAARGLASDRPVVIPVVIVQPGEGWGGRWRPEEADLPLLRDWQPAQCVVCHSACRWRDVFGGEVRQGCAGGGRGKQHKELQRAQVLCH